MESLERIVAKGPDTRLIRQCRDTSRKEDERRHTGMFAHHARGIIENFISAYSGNWYLLNEAAGQHNSGQNIDENSVKQSMNAYRHAEGWLATYRKKGSILAVLSTEGYKDWILLAREGQAIVSAVADNYYQFHAQQAIK